MLNILIFILGFFVVGGLAAMAASAFMNAIVWLNYGPPVHKRVRRVVERNYAS